MRITAAAICVLMTIGTPAAGQTAEACTFETCALRTQYGAGGISVVQGLHEEHVASLGFFSYDLADAVAASETAVALAMEAERLSRWGTVVQWGGLAVGLAAASSGLRTGGGSWAVAGSLIGYGMMVGGGVLSTRSMNRVQEAIWWYNRELAEPGLDRNE